MHYITANIYMWKGFVKDYLSYTSKERLGIFTLLVLIIACIILPFFYPYFIHKKEYNNTDFEKDIARLKTKQQDSLPAKRNYKNDADADNYATYREPSEKNYFAKTKAEEFTFDPNTTSANDWKRLGVRDKTVETIQKYISKGGHFYKPKDISKIWGLRPDDVQRLLPYVRIENSQKEDVKPKDYVDYKLQDKPFASQHTYSPQIIDINVADTTAFISLPGIGSRLANRIVTLRDKLGGFYSVDQVHETFGLPDSTFQKIKPLLVTNTNHQKQINVNAASLDDLRAHPYIRYYLANAIIQYRTQHGNFTSVEEIKNIMLVTDEVYNKISPYLSVK